MSSDLPHDSKTVDSLVKSVQQELNQDEKSLFYSLGFSFVYWNAPEGVLYSAPYERIGREVWIALRHEMYKILCDETELVPTEWVLELISGDSAM